MKRLLVTLIAAMTLIAPVRALAACKLVGDEGFISINAAALDKLDDIGIDRAAIFRALLTTATPETSGCWAGAAGNFDEQLLSAGVLQWNFGQNSLQSLLDRYRDKLGQRFDGELKRLMPVHGKFLFSDGCTRQPVTASCRDKLMELTRTEAGKKVLDPDFEREVNAVFESREMIQIQVDKFVQLLGSVQSDLARLFPDQTPTDKQIKWAIDTKVQQGGFPADEDVKRVRTKLANSSSSADRSKYLMSLIDWYRGLCYSIDQGGVRLDCEYNLKVWPVHIRTAASTEEYELIHLTFLKSRTAQGMSGHWQALTFQRRAKLIFGLGSVAGNQH